MLPPLLPILSLYKFFCSDIKNEKQIMAASIFRISLSFFFACIFVLTSGQLFAENNFSQTKAILIIDDMGNNLEQGQRAINLPGKINYAFLPHSPNTKVLANNAHHRGKEILLHLPMSNLSNKNSSEGNLSPIMNHQQFIETLHENLQAVPHVQGVNNHMGSLLTQLRQPMSWLMSALRKEQLYFIDSRTSPLTVAQSSAIAADLPNMKRDVFLDNQRTESAISAQVERWLELASQNGTAVAIAHPHPETLSVLEKMLPTLASKGITLSLISEVINDDSPMTTALRQPAPSPLKQN